MFYFNDIFCVSLGLCIILPLLPWVWSLCRPSPVRWRTREFSMGNVLNEYASVVGLVDPQPGVVTHSEEGIGIYIVE